MKEGIIAVHETVNETTESTGLASAKSRMYDEQSAAHMGQRKNVKHLGRYKKRNRENGRDRTRSQYRPIILITQKSH